MPWAGPENMSPEDKAQIQKTMNYIDVLPKVTIFIRDKKAIASLEDALALPPKDDS